MLKYLAITTSLILAACTSSNEKDIAYKVIYDTNENRINVPAMSGAIEKRFGPGAQVNDLITFTKKLDGACGYANRERYTFCEFIAWEENTQFYVHFTSEDGIIESIEVTSNWIIE